MELFGYQMYNPPFSLDFSSMSRKEARLYFKWFVENISVRLVELERALACNDGRDVKLDFSMESLCALEDWFQHWVEIYHFTSEEMQRTRDRLPERLHELLPDWTLGVQTLSLCFDIGIYVGEMFRHLHPEVHWEPYLGGRTMHNCNQPVLVPFPHKIKFNPVAIASVVAFDILDRKTQRYALRDAFLVWENLLKGIAPTSRLDEEGTDE